MTKFKEGDSVIYAGVHHRVEAVEDVKSERLKSWGHTQWLTLDDGWVLLENQVTPVQKDLTPEQEAFEEAYALLFLAVLLDELGID
jgi:hypothetical protein